MLLRLLLLLSWLFHSHHHVRQSDGLLVGLVSIDHFTEFGIDGRFSVELLKLVLIKNGSVAALVLEFGLRRDDLFELLPEPAIVLIEFFDIGVLHVGVEFALLQPEGQDVCF